MTEEILIGDRVRDRINAYRKGGDALPLSGIVESQVGSLPIVFRIDWDDLTQTIVPSVNLERVQADGSDPESR